MRVHSLYRGRGWNSRIPENRPARNFVPSLPDDAINRVVFPFFSPSSLSSSIFLEEELVRSGKEEEIDFRRNLFRLFRDLAPVETDRIEERYTRRSFLRSFLHRIGHGAINNSIDYARPGNKHDSNY